MEMTNESEQAGWLGLNSAGRIVLLTVSPNLQCTFQCTKGKSHAHSLPGIALAWHSVIIRPRRKRSRPFCSARRVLLCPGLLLSALPCPALPCPARLLEHGGSAYAIGDNSRNPNLSCFIAVHSPAFYYKVGRDVGVGTQGISKC